MRKFLSYFLTTSLAAVLMACGGGGDSSTTNSTNLADCFQVNSANAFRYATTSNPSTAQTLLAPGATSSTTYQYENTVADIAYRSDFFNGTLALARASSGTDTYTTTAAIAARPFSTSEFFTATPTFTILGQKSSYPSISFLSETVYTGWTRALGAQPGQTQNYSFIARKTIALTGGTPSFTLTTTTHTVTFAAREDLVTPAGMFKNTCKFTFDMKDAAQPGNANTPILNASPLGAGATSTVWYAPGWGVVKQDSVERFVDGRQPATLSKASAATAILAGSL